MKASLPTGCSGTAPKAATKWFPNVSERPVVCMQGLGFVGLAMGVAVASAKDSAGNPLYNVIGVDLPTKQGMKRIDSINRGILPFKNNDKKMAEAFKVAVTGGNLIATSDPSVFSLASVTLVSINLDLQCADTNPHVNMDALKSAFKSLGQQMTPGSLIIVETTVPPGTCEKVAVPVIQSELEGRGLPGDAIQIAHSYERVMPGDEYLSSIINYWRVYAGHTAAAADACERFLSTVINVKEYPLMRMRSMTASETGKVLENSYRAVNIAFIEEWGRFAEAAGIDLFEVINGIRKRPTHSNMRQPGFGVGGYCITKDPAFAKIGARDLLGIGDLEFPFSEKAMKVNSLMPMVTLNYIRKRFQGDLKGKKILLLGVSYRPDIGDTRYSPSQVFVEKAEECGAKVVASDPLLDYWPEMDRKVEMALPNPRGFDIIVFAVAHKDYARMDLAAWLKGSHPFLFDANYVVTTSKLLDLKKAGYDVQSIGRGLL